MSEENIEWDFELPRDYEYCGNENIVILRNKLFKELLEVKQLLSISDTLTEENFKELFVKKVCDALYYAAIIIDLSAEELKLLFKELKNCKEKKEKKKIRSDIEEMEYIFNYCKELVFYLPSKK